MRLAAPLIFCSVALLALAFGLSAQFLLTAPASTTPINTTTDDWRRTATGWERTHSWPINHAPVGHSSSPPHQPDASARLSSHQPDAQARPSASDPSLPTPHSALRVLLPVAQSSTPSPRLDTHPAVLALLQITGSLLALAFFRTNSHHLSLKSLLSSISHSFRASPFG